MNLRDLLEQRARLVAQMRALADAPAGDGGDLSDEQSAQFDRHRGELETVEQRIQRQQTLDEAERRMQGTQLTGSGDDRFDREVRSFSLVRAIAGAAGLNVDASHERDISQELQRRTGLRPQGILVPMEVFQRRVEQRVTLTTGSGGNLVAEDLLAGQFIDVLRARLVTGRLGARILSGLVGNVEIPRRTGSVASGWVAENAALSLSDATFDQVPLTPKHVGGLTELSRNMLQQSTPDIEQLTRADLAAVLAEAIDAAALSGSGTPPEPEGIINISGVGSFTLTATPTWPEVLGAIEDIDVANAEGSGWAMHPSARSVFRQTVKEAGFPDYLMNTPNEMAGYGVQTTTTLPTNLTPGTATPVIFGMWSDLLIGYWSAFDLLVNPYETTAYSKGNVQVRAMLTADVAVRHPLSFTVGSLDLA